MRGIEHGADRANLGHHQHRDQQFRAVFDEDPDHITFANTLGNQIMSNAVGPLVDLCITESDFTLQQRRAIGIAVRRLLEAPTEAAGLIRLYDIGDLKPPDHPWQGFGNGRQLTEHHAPGDHVV
ncbi:hypothetical protein HK44_025065 [Pseudomonas fluorescens HK44]|uniref:Uncharacterized protein n=1 Tax=Pseudomonas fluorescens HK44 TaxID=1042209 RepID=A0A010RTB8_PSEFL|nr:hypothetical protein HK44_025065 [Pseudomonas fluorescens HK44]